MEVLLDGESIYTFSDKYMESGQVMKWIPLPDEAGERILTLRTPYSKKTEKKTWLHNSYLRTQSQIILYLVKCNSGMIIAGILLIAMSILTIFYGLKLGKKLSENSRKSLWFLCLFILLAGVWIFSDLEIMKLLVRYAAVLTVFSFTAFMIMPVFFILFIQSMLTCRKMELLLSPCFI